MDRLNSTETGGFPRSMDDLRFMEDSTIEALKNVVKSFRDQIILWGIDAINTGSVINWNAGAIFIDNEIFSVDAGSISYSQGSYYVFSVVEEENTPVLFADTTVKNAYLSRKATVIEVEAIESNLNLFSESFNTYVNETLLAAQEFSPGTWATYTLNGANGFFKYRKSEHFVEIYYSFNSQGAVSSQELVLATSLRPSIDLSQGIHSYSSDGYGVININSNDGIIDVIVSSTGGDFKGLIMFVV